MDFKNYNRLDIEDDLIDDVYYDNSNIIVIKKIQSEINFIEGWDDTQSFVAGEIQANLDELGLDENLAWNIYIIFLINFEIGKKEKNSIESNKFCCKKYVLQVDDLSNEEAIMKRIENTIALFAEFDFTKSSSSFSNKEKIKEKIFQNSNKSIMVNTFMVTPNIDKLIEENSIAEFINRLKGEYINEN